MISPAQMKKIEKISDPVAKQKYLKYFQLPQDIQDIFFTVETADKVRKVSKDNNLNDIQIWHFSYIVGMILLGETHITKFVQSIQEKCGLTEEMARQAARGVNREIFLAVKESLKKIHRVPEWPRENEAKEKKQESVEPEPKLNGNVVDLKNH